MIFSIRIDYELSGGYANRLATPSKDYCIDFGGWVGGGAWYRLGVKYRCFLFPINQLYPRQGRLKSVKKCWGHVPDFYRAIVTPAITITTDALGYNRFAERKRFSA